MPEEEDQTTTQQNGARPESRPNTSSNEAHKGGEHQVSSTESSLREKRKNNVVDALLTANYTSVLFGWLAMMGAALVLSSIISGFIAAGFDQDGSDTNAVRSWERVSFLATVFLAFLVGGYVAGRMAGRSGVRHGLLVPLLALVATTALVLFGLLIGVSLVENLSGVTLPELPRQTRQSLDSILSASGVLALILIPFVGGAFGGAWGARTERQIIRKGYEEEPESG